MGKELQLAICRELGCTLKAQRDLLLAVVKRLVEIGELANKEYDRWEPQAHLYAMVERLQNLDDEAQAAIALAVTGEQDAQDTAVLTPSQFEAAIDGIAERHAAEDAYLLDDEGDDNCNRDS